MAFRRDLFDFFPDDTVIDDFDLTLLLRRKGFRSIILEDVFIYEPCMDTVKYEFMQIRRRIYTAILSTQKYRSDLFNTQMGYYGWVILPSRRLLPLFVPLALVIIFIASFSMWPLPTVLAAGGTSLYLVGLKRYFVFLQFAAIAAAWYDFCISKKQLTGDVWCRTD